MLVYNEHNFGYWDITMDELKELAKTKNEIQLARVNYKTYQAIQEMFKELNYKVTFNTIALYTVSELLGIQIWR